MMKKSKKTMVLTGAGISTDSGIPDFRSRDTGLWEKIDPMEFSTSRVLMEEPEKFYSNVYNDENKDIEYEPNRGHFILSELEDRKLIDSIVTQNIDHLHQDAGSKLVYEVHGNVKNGYCLECGQSIKSKNIRKKVEGGQIPPRCDYCEGIVRPSVVLFGDSLPDEYLIAKEEISKSDLLIVIGSSLSVSPINMVTRLARQFVIINREETMMDDIADLCINESITVALEKLIEIL